MNKKDLEGIDQVTYKKVKCVHCGASGVLRITPEHNSLTGELDYDVEEFVKHKRGCPLRPEQPKHFKNKRKWQRGEKRGNEIVGAKETKVSGALNKDGDGRIINHWRVETKTTEKEYYRLTKELWNKLAEGAISCGEEPIFYVETSFASFVVYRDLSTDKPKKKTSPKSILLNKRLALELNKEDNRLGQLMVGWENQPCVTLRRNFRKEQINER